MPLENFIQDLRYGVRMLRRNPLFAAAAVITLGLGLGATLAVFNVFNGVLLRPLPYRDPERIDIIWFALRGDDGNVWKLPLSSGSYLDIERDSRSFEALAAFRAWPYAIAESPDAEREPVAGARVSPALFDASDVGNYGVQNLVAIGKLSERCGTGACSASVAQAELTAVLRRSIPVNDQPKSAYQLVSMVDQAAERVRRPLFILLGAVAFVL